MFIKIVFWDISLESTVYVLEDCEQNFAAMIVRWLFSNVGIIIVEFIYSVGMRIMR